MIAEKPMLFKILGKTDSKRAVSQLAPIIQQMKEEDSGDEYKSDSELRHA
jgi:hypothetical protein